ncbi:MAG: hypothetical protein JNJ92_08900 [Altererythrobacter sp.]|nr:hypothetical protein [Altererythrobacter sp.]
MIKLTTKRFYYFAGIVSLACSALITISPAAPALTPIFVLMIANWIAFMACSLAMSRLPGGTIVGLASWKNRDFNFWRVVLLSFSIAGFFAFSRGVAII